jgi:WD40 repeat protein
VDGSIVRWETKPGDADLGERVAPVAFLGGHAGRVTALAVSEEDSLLLSGDDDGVVCAWDTRTNACVARRDFSSHAENPCAAVVSIEMKEKTSTSPPTKIARARFAGESPARALEPRTLRSVKDIHSDERFCSSGEETQDEELCFRNENEREGRSWRDTRGGLGELTGGDFV